MRMREREGVIFDQSFRGRVVKEKGESEFDVSGESQNILQNSSLSSLSTFSLIFVYKTGSLKLIGYLT